MNADKLKQMGFIAAGLANIAGVLTFSQLFTNDVLNQASPMVMSKFGLLMICVWGMAYIAVNRSYAAVKPLVAVFALEKFVYVIAWCTWMFHNHSQLPQIYDESLFAGIFLTIYGSNDLLFMMFFLWVYRSQEADSQSI